MKILVKTKEMSRKEWLEWRRKGIGGSDVSIIAGINKFKSVFQLWLEKTGQIKLEETESEYAHFGTVLEPIIKKEFIQRTGKKVRAKRQILQSEEYPFMLCDLDGVIYEEGEMCIFEAKTASAYKQNIWEKEVPVEYVLQVQHYMAVTGAKKTYVAALVGGNHFYNYIIYRDEELINLIIRMEQEFWENYVLTRKEPIPDGSEATASYLNKKYEECNGKTIELPKEVLEIISQYDDTSQQMNEIKERKEALINQLKNYLKENETGVIGSRKISWKQVTKTSFDKKRLEKENKQLYEKYVTESQYRRFMIA